MILLQEVVDKVGSHAAELSVHSLALELVRRIAEVTEVASAVIIAIGIAGAIYRLGRMMLYVSRQSDRERLEGYQKIRMRLSRFLALALEFQLAADLLATTIAPSWDQLGRLAAVAAIRTFLNYFLEREMKAGTEE